MTILSILLPFYNARATLDECIDSIRGQTLQDWELIAVDDGSEDGSAGIMARHAADDARIKVVRLDRNVGIVAALNEGLRHCQGELIARMDADDRMLPHRLAVQQNYLVSHPEVDLLGCGVRIFRDDDEPSPAQVRLQDWHNSLIEDQQIRDSLFCESPIMHPTFLVRKRLYQRLEGYRLEVWPEDYDFLFRAVLARAKLACLPEVLVEKRDAPDRLYHTDPRCKRKSMLRARAHFFPKFYGRPEPLYLVGSGSTGRTVHDQLAEEGIAVQGFFDARPVARGRTLRGKPVFSIEDPDRMDKTGFFILCIGQSAGRTIAEEVLKRNGRLEGRHYLRFL